VSDPVEGDHHMCCCWHVVNTLEAMPGPAEERYAQARDRLADCPHTHERTNLEAYVEELRDQVAAV
jgi:hypothetical protein